MSNNEGQNYQLSYESRHFAPQKRESFLRRLPLPAATKC